MSIKNYILPCVIALLAAACSTAVPNEAEEAGRHATVMPDNDGATLPPNIAPLNFLIQEEGEAFVTRLSTRGGQEVVISGQTVSIDLNDWRVLLQAAVGDTLWTDIYVEQSGQWHHFDRMANPVVADSIDPYITYRLIRPSYVMYEELTLNERSLETFDERVIYENMTVSRDNNGQCINCHVPQGQGQSGRSQFHARQTLGGTVLIDGNRVTKVNLKTDSTLSAGVYPAWHPTLNLIAYSVNETGQSFHTLDPQKIEVIDYASDLILYDPERNQVQHIERTARDYESFPTWSPDGLTLYYISAHHDPIGSDIDADLDQNYETLHYNIYARDFNLDTRQFGPRRLVFDAESLGKSASTPRVSPDGQWLLFSLADYGQFHVWHKSADLWMCSLNSLTPSLTTNPSPKERGVVTDGVHEGNVVDTSLNNASSNNISSSVLARSSNHAPLLGRGVGGEAGGEAEASPLNSPECESYHAWSSNGRWILFSSRRLDGNYTRLYIAYFGPDGKARRPFLLPQRQPLHDLQLLRSYNVAEFMVHPVQPSRQQLLKAIRTEARQATYDGSALQTPEHDADASAPLHIANQNHHNIYESD